MPSNFSVLIPDGESPFAIHVLTCLAEAGGIDIHLVSRRNKVMGRYSRFIKSFHLLADEQDRLNYIEGFCKKVHVDLIMPVDMDAILYFTKRRELLTEIAELSLLDNAQKLKNVSDKGSFADFLRANALPHPRSITSVEEFNTVIQQFKMPVLVKPRTSGNGEGISKYTERMQLIDLVKSQSRFFDDFLIQEYVDGHDIDCSVLCRDGVVLAYTIQQSLYPSDSLYQPAEAIEFVSDSQVLETTTRLMAALNWTGIAHVDLRRRTANAQVEIIEINPRFWGSIQGSLHAGVNFPHLVCLASRGQTFPMPQYHHTKYMSFFSVIKRLRQNLPVTHLVRETNLLAMAKDPLPRLLKLAGYVE